jgi:hypothetical protein
MAGKLLLKVKPPPTNRFWVGFYQMPQMEWEVAPIVSDKQIRFSMVTNAIQSKIREFIAENIVLPNMDDFPFFSCTGQGGVFGTRVPKPSSPETQQQQEILLKQGDSIQNTVKSDDTTSMTDDATKKKKMVDAAKALERDEYSNASLQPHSLSACGTESINVDEPEIINCQIHHFSTPNPFSPGINHLGARGYSSLELSESYQSKPFNLSNELLNDQTVLIDDSILSSPSFSSNQISSDLSENIGLRKRHLSRGSSLESSLAEEQLKRNHSYHDSESKLQIDSQEPVTISMASHFSENDLYTFTRDSLDLNGREKNMSSTCSSLSSTCSTTTATSKTTTMGFGKSSLFFKFRNSNNNAKQHERKSDTRKSIFLNTKKDEFYSLANSIFKKTKNLRKEGDENGKGRLEGQTQLKISSFPPPLPPPRKSNNPAVQTTLVGSDNCFLSDERISTDEYKPPPVVSKLNVSDNDEPNLLEPFILSSSSPPPYHERIANFSFA